METFTASSAKLFVENQKDKYASFGCLTPRRDVAAFSRPEIRSLGYLKHVNLGFSSLSVSLPRKTVQPISAAPALSASSEDQTCDANEGIESEDKDKNQFKTVHVKFQLQSECSFGQQFLMVGDDPMLGLWDPLNAIPMNWSEGHVWTVEMDIPCDKVMKYKFILKGVNDTIFWQPGPDRILQTWETRKTITVCEDWYNAERQTIIEEDPVTHQLMAPTENPEVLIVTDNLLRPSGEPGTNVNKELNITNGYAQPKNQLLAEKPLAIVAENITEQNGEKKVETNGFSSSNFTINTNKVATSGINDHQNSGRSGRSENLIVAENEINLDSGAAIPVLVPGLTPIPTAEIQEASVRKADNHIITDSPLGSYKTEEFNVPELHSKEEPGVELPIHKEETETLLNGKLELQDKGQVREPQLFEEKDQPNTKGLEERVLENDIQWGRRTLQKFLVNLGFL